ncbi:nuclear transport factor 2 family protein [Rheinheimera sp. YQF-2]|uniref:Nuclear transport factor 2 family protein n=1 Tax=Rheinheimera lutimaris TaxID=2740584 RepID=A0A7Y5EHL0_9GAMM|nr:nuclear transport factor 2 family protein [Rheinheimera lutimaris]NRQ41356.1 nuclear transport factor 2 family protein [Rheinheimera lutimaris]
MNIQLADPIKNYFEISNGTDPVRLKHCFNANAVVLDEGGTYQGHTAIAAWFCDTRQKYAFSAKPLSATTQQQHEIVTAEVSGNFPGSPIELSYTFLLQDGKIQSLKIA